MLPSKLDFALSVHVDRSNGISVAVKEGLVHQSSRNPQD